MPELGREILGLGRRQRVLLSIRLQVPIPGRHAGPVGQIPFPEPVGPDDSQRVAAARVRQPDPRLVGEDEAHLLEPGEEPHRTGVRRLQRTSEALLRAPASGVLAVVEVLKGVLDAYAITQPPEPSQARRQPPPRPEDRRHGAERQECQEWIDQGSTSASKL